MASKAHLGDVYFKGQPIVWDDATIIRELIHTEYGPMLVERAVTTTHNASPEPASGQNSHRTTPDPPSKP